MCSLYVKLESNIIPGADPGFFKGGWLFTTFLFTILFKPQFFMGERFNLLAII